MKPSFKIRWRNRARYVCHTVEGLSRYTFQAAEAQVARWQALFPQNTYYIEPA